jgi:hypothetical protein
MERRELLRMIPALPVVLGARAAAAQQREAAPGDPWTIDRGVDGSLVRP